MDPSYNEINVGLGNVATYTYNYIKIRCGDNIVSLLN